MRAMSSLQVRYYPRFYVSGFLWNMTRWMGVFVGAYLVNERTGSPLAVQLVGTAFFLPMFLGGLVAGTIADRHDRRRTLARNLAMLAPLALGMALLLWTGRLSTTLVYVFVFCVGVGGVLDMTSRRALVYDLVGDEHITNAVALEMFSLSFGNMVGFLVGGAVLDLIGVGWAYALTAVLYGTSLAILLTMPSQPRTGEPAAGAALSVQIAEGLAFLRRSTTLRSVLGITILVNVFMFSFQPLVPVFAERLEVGAFETGLLGSATGTGMMIGSLFVAATLPRRGHYYAFGSALAFVGLFWLPIAPHLALAWAALVATGIGAGMFGATQSGLVMSIAGPELRGRAMGMLSMAIGGLPFGIFALGLLAEGVGAATAVLISTATGLVLFVIWSLFIRPEVWTID